MLELATRFHFVINYNNVRQPHVYAPPQKVASYYCIPSEILSVRPSVCPSPRMGIYWVDMNWELA